ncbi:MAG: HAMP domain-containing protein [Verrucomicrobiales bacterium]|nr:HAMP domain-containing protein [Verrucomicrobiales bacterium]
MKTPRFMQSLRVRLLAWLAFLLACVLTGFGVTAYQLHRINLFDTIDEDLESRLAVLNRELRSRMGGPGHLRAPPPIEWLFDGAPDRPPEVPKDRSRDRSPDAAFEPAPLRPGDRRGSKMFGPMRGFPDGRFENREINLSSITSALFDEAGTNGFYFSIWSRSGTPMKCSTNAPAALPIPDFVGASGLVQSRTRERTREVYQFNGIGECVLVGRSIDNDLSALRLFGGWLVLAGTGVLALGLGGGWLLTTRAIRPVHAIGSAARRIAAGDLSERIRDVDSESELGRLAGVLNSTFARLESAFAQQKQFTADASHELRTPISVIIAEAQTTLARERSAAEYKETVETCLEAAQQMRRLTQSLLELARFDAGQERLERSAFDLAERLRACVEWVEPLAKPRGITLHADLPAITVQGDPDRLCQVFTNLLTNAIHYNRDHGRVVVTARAEPHAAVVSVTDTGPGIAPDDLPHLFERFYRGDKSRSTVAGRTGLGLAIAKAIVDAHGGRLEASGNPGSGSTFTVHIPLDINDLRTMTLS